ncbi:MAG: hypothetical protein KH452_01970 [Clostridiales bacterium]|nr:hypothetical protein [Clostridiales bacterium]
MRYICQWLGISICGVLAALTVLLVLPGLFHIQPLVMETGSMEPSYPEGSVIYVRNVEEEDVENEDTVVLRLQDGRELRNHQVLLCVPYLGYLAEGLASAGGKAAILLLVVTVCLLSWMDGTLQSMEKMHKT